MQVELIRASIAEEWLLILRLGLETLPLVDRFLIDADLSAKLTSEVVHLHEVFLDVFSHHLMNELEHRAILPCHGGEHEISEDSQVWNDVREVKLLVVVISHIHLIKLLKLTRSKVPC